MSALVIGWLLIHRLPNNLESTEEIAPDPQRRHPRIQRTTGTTRRDNIANVARRDGEANVKKRVKREKTEKNRPQQNKQDLMLV